MKKAGFIFLCIFFAGFVYSQEADNAMAILPNGNVGVGTKEPTQKLEVNGRIKDKTGFVMPVGTILAYGGTDAPEGWLLCDGKALKSTDYPDLYAAIKTNFGNGSTENNGNTPAIRGDFNLPDLRGQFLRGVDNPQGQAADLDPDAAKRTANNIGGNDGNRVGSKQQDEVKQHNHGLPRDGMSGTYHDDTVPWYDRNTGGNSDMGLGTGSYGNSIETRPKNVYVNYIIKY